MEATGFKRLSVVFAACLISLSAWSPRKANATAEEAVSSTPEVEQVEESQASLIQSTAPNSPTQDDDDFPEGEVVLVASAHGTVVHRTTHKPVKASRRSKAIAAACNSQTLANAMKSAGVPASQRSCYIALFNIETSCHPRPQKAGNAGNPYAARGICSMEASSAVLKRNGRDSSCYHTDLANQVRCCRATMIKTRGAYFGGVLRGEIHRCN